MCGSTVHMHYTCGVNCPPHNAMQFDPEAVSAAIKLNDLGQLSAPHSTIHALPSAAPVAPLAYLLVEKVL